MAWTTEEKLTALMRLPWTITVAHSEFGTYYTAECAELPDALATGDDERSVARSAFSSIRASLAARLEFDDEIPLPTGQLLPWIKQADPARPLRFQKVFALPPKPDEDGIVFASSGGGREIPRLLTA